MLKAQTGYSEPRLVVEAEGVHDVGRLLATLARGNCEQARLADDTARRFRRTAEGRQVLAYLESHGGPVLGKGRSGGE